MTTVATESVTRSLWRWRLALVEVAVAAGIFALAASVGSFATRHFYGQPLFYQHEFGPAVMLATGRGFVNPVVTPRSPLEDFLLVRRRSIGPEEVEGVAVQPFDQFQNSTRYLILALGYVWKSSEISWIAVSRLAALLYGLTVVAGYAIARMWLRRALAVVPALFMCFSPLHLMMVPHIRDYSKAPFILWAIVLTVCVSLRPLSRRMLVLLSAAAGAVIGIGLGFRMDVTVMVPIFLISLVAFRDRRPWTGVFDKALATTAFVLAFVVSSGPVLSRLSSGGSNGFHVILLGYSDPFEPQLGIRRASYSFLPFYDDSYLTMVLQRYGSARTGQVPSFPSAEYDAAGRSYWLAIVRHFPADVLTRALGAANVVLNVPFQEPTLNFLKAPGSRSNPLWNVLTNQLPHRARISAFYESLSALDGWGLLFGIVFIGAACAHNVRVGLFAIWMVLALAGYSSLQFSNRHYFHLEVIGAFGLVVVARLAVESVFRPPGWRATRRLTTSIAVLAIGTVMSVGVLRAYQRVHLRGVFSEYVDSPKQAVQPMFADLGGGVWRAQWNALRESATIGNRVATDYYVVEFDGDPAQRLSLLDLRYKSTSPMNDYSRIVSMPETAGVARIFVPAYGEPPAWGLDAIEFPAGIKNRLRGIYRLTRPERLPFLFELRLAGTWREEGLNQTLRIEGSGLPDGIQLLGGAGNAGTSRMALIGRADSIQAAPSPADVAQALTDAVRFVGGRIEMDGIADTQSSYLLQFKPVEIAAPTALVVRGHLFTGGLVFGLLKDGQWYRQLGTGVPGDFVGIIEITESGTYTPLITNATQRDHDRNRFMLSDFRFVKGNLTRP